MKKTILLAVMLLFVPLVVAQNKPAWEGQYTFTETGNRNSGEVLDYVITVRQRKGSFVADVDIDGFQTSTRLRCAARAAGNRLSLYLTGYRAENAGEPYKKGDLLLSLEQSGGKLLTHWAEIQPQLRRLKNGGEYFKTLGQKTGRKDQ